MVGDPSHLPTASRCTGHRAGAEFRRPGFRRPRTTRSGERAFTSLRTRVNSPSGTSRRRIRAHRAPSRRGARAEPGGHRLRARRSPRPPPNPRNPWKVVLRPAEGEEDPYRRHALLGGRGAEAPRRSVPTAGGGASVGKPEVRGRKFSPLFTTRLGNAVAVNTGNTYTWKPAPAEAALIPPRAEERIPGRGRRPRRTASTCCGTPMPRSCWRPESPS